MADRHNYYFGELVTEDELDEGFAWLEQADRDQNRDVGLTGIMVPHAFPLAGMAASWSVTENTIPDWNVLVTTGYAADKLGRRIAVDPPTTVLVDCSVDYLGVSNAVAAGNERWITLYLKFATLLSDPRIDDNGLTVYFDVAESYELEVRQGPEEASPAVTKPARDATALIIADVLITNAMPPILNADIDYLTRVEYLVNVSLAGAMPPAWAPSITSVYGRNLEEAIRALTVIIGDGADSAYLDLAGTSPMAGSIKPDVTCTRDLGQPGKLWRRGYFQSLIEQPDAVSGISSLTIDDTWPTLLTRFQSIVKRTKSAMVAFYPEFTNAHGRRNTRYLDARQEFLYSQSHPGPFDYRTAIAGTGQVINNPALWAFAIANGFIQLLVPAVGDSARAYNDAYPLLTSRQPSCEFGWLKPSATSTGSEAFYFGMNDASVGAFVRVMYDPLAILNPFPPNGNLWVAFWDGVMATPLWTDTLVPLSFDSYQDWIVAFEKEGAGSMYLRVYMNINSLVFEYDLTAAGYEATFALAAFDWDVQLDSIPLAGGGEELLLDYVHMCANRDY